MYHVDVTARNYPDSVKFCQQKEGKLPETFSSNLIGIRSALAAANIPMASIYLAVGFDDRAQRLRYYGSGNALPPLTTSEGKSGLPTQNQVQTWEDSNQCLTLQPITNQFFPTDCDAVFPTVCAPADTLKERIIAQAAASTYAKLIEKAPLKYIQSAVATLSWETVDEEDTPCALLSNTSTAITMNSALDLWFSPSTNTPFDLQLLSKLWSSLTHDLETFKHWDDHLQKFAYLQHGPEGHKCICSKTQVEHPVPITIPVKSTGIRPLQVAITDIWAFIADLRRKVTSLSTLHNIKISTDKTRMPPLNLTQLEGEQYFKSTGFWVDLAFTAAAVSSTAVVLILLILRRIRRASAPPTNHQEGSAHYRGHPPGSPGDDGERRVRFYIPGASPSDDRISDLTRTYSNPSTRGSSTSSLSRDSTHTPWFALLERLRNPR